MKNLTISTSSLYNTFKYINNGILNYHYTFVNYDCNIFLDITFYLIMEL